MVQIFETFGPTLRPMYSIRFPSAESINQRNIAVGQRVYHTPQRSHFIFPSSLAQIKGSDASNVYDEEPDSDEREFSDDEQERAAKQRQVFAVFVVFSNFIRPLFVDTAAGNRVRPPSTSRGASHTTTGLSVE